MAAAPEYSAIPDPTIDPASIHETVVALKHTVEVLTGLRGTGSYAAVTRAGLIAQQNLAGADPATVLNNIGLGSAWVSYTPTITANAGTFTTVSATGKYKQIGKTVHVSIVIVITTNGTASGYVSATLPLPQVGSVVYYGRAVVVSGKMLQGVNVVASTIAILNYDGTYPGANGEVLFVAGTYETT